MGKKHKHPEHINLERWLISYADFITLLFATFVVLYALSQVDIKDFKALENSIKQAFDAPSVMQGNEGVMSASSSLFDQSQADSMITPLMMEYVSQKYEEQSMQQIEQDINQENKDGEVDGVEVFRTDKGLLIRFSGDVLFKPASAELTPAARLKLDKIGAIIAKKFVLHNMRVEGHTDNQAMKSAIYPSNWELSSARASAIIRYFIGRFSFMPSLFTAVGFAHTRPIVDNSSPGNMAKNRRVEILILKNRFKSQESATNDIMKMSKEEQAKMQAQRLDTIKQIESLSKKAKMMTPEEKKAQQDAMVINKVYNKELMRISKESQGLDPKTREKATGQGAWLKPPARIDQIKPFK